jgi:hypothetical protein
VTVNTSEFALFYPEKQPFFLEGLEQFDTPNALIYTRRINAPHRWRQTHRQTGRHGRRVHRRGR